MNVLELINLGSKKLRSNRINSSKLDSEILLSKVLGKKRERVLVDFQDQVASNEILKYNQLINRRYLKEPIAYILKKKEFWSKLFEVNENTLIPRPETELMVEKIIKIYKGKKISILDIGTGSGCILISLLDELKNSNGVGIDISKKALIVAKKNARNHNLAHKIKFIHKPLTNIFNIKFDLVVSNPPYIKKSDLKNLQEDIKMYEPLVALDGGNDGLDVIKKVIYKAKYILKIRGKLALEIGNEQYLEVSKILKRNNFRIEHYIKDYKENIRCLISSLKK
tara:strand:+ start:152 stop:994 length:843 start_codon:yes stop_codon:yes gene_type:complete